MSEEENKENTVEIEEITKPEPTAFATDGLAPKEIELAKKHGLIEEEKKVDETSKVDESSKKETDAEHKEQSETETEEPEKEDEEKAKTFEEVEKDENKLKKFNSNEQALYWKYKSDKKKRQSAQKGEEEAVARYELEIVKTIAANKKLEQVAEALKGENLTVEQIQAIIGGEVKAEKSNLLTVEKYEELESAKKEEGKVSAEEVKEHKERIADAETAGVTKYGKEEFDRMTNLVAELKKGDKGDFYDDILKATFSDKTVDASELADRVATLAKIHPDFGKKKEESVDTEDKETDVTRAIKNSKKKVSSASVGSGGKKVIAYDDLTPEDAALLSDKQWSKLPRKTKDRLLGKTK